jgi:ABC-type transport system involved in cytochrome bd biosynthesis fused ATPase/permease subunit
VPQGNNLFSGTIRDNLRMVNREASDEQLKEALGTACADFVWDLAQGLDTEIGENGLGLSEGQAQRLAVARAMLLPGSVWIFDEVTAALDAGTAQQLITNLLEKGKDKILLFVTHDAALRDRCVRIIQCDASVSEY